MNILYQGNILIEDVVLTQSAEHEEELMKSDFIKLSWDDAEKMILPVGAYIEYKGIEYSLLEPYEPEQKSEAQWHYEPHFQHPKMYLSKVTFVRPTKDSDNEDITLLDWPYTGFIGALLEYFCEQINAALNLSGNNAFAPVVIGEFNNVISITFNTQDILSALTNTANQLECEWHLDWEQKQLYFGRISYLRTQLIPPTLKVDDNIGIPSIRNSKEGYWNAFEPQGSTRNITKRAASGEYVQGNVRLSLRDYKVDGEHEHGIYPDGIVYTNGEGTIITKEQFLALGEKPFIKSLIFEEVYPKLDLYAYNIRYRERYLLEDEDNPDSKVIDHYDDNGNPVYKRYAVWYMRLAWPEYEDAEHTIVSQWHDYDISEVRDTSAGITIVQNPQGNYIEMDIDIDATQSWFTNESVSYPGTYIVQVKAHDITIKGYISGYYLDQGRVRFYAEYVSDTPEDDRDEPSLANLTAFKNAIQQTDTITFESGVDKKKFPKLYSQIIDGKQLYGQFKVNTRPTAESTPLAGRGDGDNGNYGFGLVYLGMEGQSYINKANLEPTEEGDSGIVDMGGSRAVVTDKDYEIVFQQSDNFILPTTKDDLIIPKGKTEPSLLGNIVNLYNIVMDSSYTESAKTDLENETKKYIATSLEDNNSYTFKTNPVEWERILREDQAQNTDSHLFIGEKVYYVDGKTYTDENPLATRVMKVVTKIDYDFEQEITIGNEVLKGAQTTLKEQVETLVSGGAGGTGGGGMSDSSVQRIVQNWVTPRFLSKINNDTAQGLITFLKGLLVGNTGRYGISHDGTATLLDMIFDRVLKSKDARKGFSDGKGIYMDALEGLIETDGLNVRGFMRIMELIINRLQLMESDYSFTEGDTVDHIGYEDNGQTLVLTMHKDHDTDFTPFYPGDIIYGIVNMLLERSDVVGHEEEWEQQGYEVKNDAVYYHTWMRVKSVDHTNNQIRVALFEGQRQDGTAIVPGATNFSPYGTAITTDVAEPMYEEYEAHEGIGYDTMLTVTRHGNVADGIDPETGLPDEHILAAQKERQQSWVLSTTDKRLSFFWRVDAPIVADDNYALCLGILPNLANLPITRDPDMPSLYINTLFADHIEQANYPARVVKTDRGQWLQAPTATYEGDISGTWTPDGTTITEGVKTYGLYVQTFGQVGVPQSVNVGDTINEPYHYRTFTKSDWLTKRLSAAWQSKSDAELERMMLVEAPKADLEVSRSWNNGIVWESVVDGTSQAPIWGCTDWNAIGGDNIFYCEILSSAGTTFRNGNVDTILTMSVRYGQEEITDRQLQKQGTTVQWIRKTGWDAVNHCFIQTSEDRAWQATQGATAKSIVVVRNDMGSGWMIDYRQAMFCCSIFVSEGNSSEVMEYEADFIQKA